MSSIGEPAHPNDKVVDHDSILCTHWAEWQGPPKIAVMIYESGNVRVVCREMKSDGKCPANTGFSVCPVYLDYTK